MSWQIIRLANGNMKFLCPRCNSLWISEFCGICWKEDQECRVHVLDVDVNKFLQSRREA